MIFRQHFRPAGTRNRSSQRLAAARRAIAKEQAKTPLFPTFFSHESVDERLDRIDTGVDASVHAMRDFRARTWRKSRQQVRRMDDDERALLLLYWRQSTYPKTAEYFADLVHRWPTTRDTFLAILEARRGLRDWQEVRERGDLCTIMALQELGRA